MPVLSTYIPKSGTRRGSNKKVVPGCNNVVKGSHEMVKSAFLTWRRKGSPQEGIHAENMHLTRLKFKYAPRRCRKKTGKKIKLTLLQRRLETRICGVLEGDIQMFYLRTPLMTFFDDMKRCKSIAEHWKHYFQIIIQERTCASVLHFFDSMDRENDNVPAITENKLKML